MSAAPELDAERAHLDFARGCLESMRERAERIADYGVDELSAFALGRLRQQRLESLDADPDAPPFFARVDRDPDHDPDRDPGHDPDRDPGHGPSAAAETLHIGRRHVRDERGDPVVMDWRAPLARGFYRATPADRMGVRLRRRFGFAAGTLTSFEDEQLDRGENLGLDSQLLRAEIERPRVGPMRDIVATIQPDQDDLVRADLDTSLCVQGAPGTGKTAVGLHRAAYLLYTYPERLRRSGVLVVGPNAAFLHYIEQVLPSLGEAGITQATVTDLLPYSARGSEADDVAILKHDARMAAVLRRAVLAHVRKPAEDVVAIIGTRRYRIGAHHLRRYVDDARRAVLGDERTSLRWNIARDRLRTQAAEDVRRQREDAGGAPSDAETAKVARSPAVREWVDSVWPALEPRTVLSRLFAEPEFLARCAAGEFTDAELAALQRAPGRSPRTVRWTPADAVLLDELAGLLEGTDTFVHAVVDEAQDLSAMQCRVVARRCPLGSLTVLGDLAQATTPWAPGDWQVTLTQLGHDAAITPLTAGYRVPGTVLALANRLLPHIARNVPPATSIRDSPDALAFAPLATLTERVSRFLAVEGSVGVIVTDDAASVLTESLRANLADKDLARVEVVPATQAKGLEFDSVIVVEPTRIVAAEARRVDGLRRLYVVLTRAVSRLCVLHDEPLPAELSAD